MRNIIIL